jgi:hypothetical protein
METEDRTAEMCKLAVTEFGIGVKEPALESRETKFLENMGMQLPFCGRQTSPGSEGGLILMVLVDVFEVLRRMQNAQVIRQGRDRGCDKWAGERATGDGLVDWGDVLIA